MILNTDDGKGTLYTCNGAIFPEINFSRTHIYFKHGVMNKKKCDEESRNR